MRDGSAVRFREKLVVRGIALVVSGLGGALGLAGIAGGIAVGASGDAAAGLALAGTGTALSLLLMALGIAGGVARTVITERAVYLQAGPRVIAIPLDSVLDAEAGTRSSNYRSRRDLSVLPVGSSSVTITHRTGEHEVRTIVSTRDAPALLRAIRREPHRATRVDASDDGAGNEEEEYPVRARHRRPSTQRVGPG